MLWAALEAERNKNESLSYILKMDYEQDKAQFDQFQPV